MTSLKKSIDRRVGSLFAVAALVLATVTPGLVPAFASAAQLSERSIELSSSSVDMTGVTYKVSFTAISSFKAVVLDFCNNTPLIGADCTAPAGSFSVAAATTPTANYSVASGTASDANTIVLENSGTVPVGPVSVEIAGVTNPSTAGPLYVRIATYDTATNAGDYVSNEQPDTGAVDQGSAAASITDTVGVSGAVLETMTFCVAGNVINQAGCTTTDNGGVLKAPTVKLGKTTGTVTALTAEEVSEASIYSQISTNAVTGAVVSLRSTAENCGGLLRAGASDPDECNIAPALNTGIALGEAKFGVKTNTAAGIVGNSNGAFQPVGGSFYNNSTFALNYVDGDGSGVTGPFGDPFLNTNGAPASNMGMQITFGASIAPNTPAGLYSTDLSLIATGKF